MTPTPTPEEQRDRMVFYPVAVMGAIFCMTIFICLAAVFGDPKAPLNQWVDQHGTRLLVIETALLVVIGLLSMIIDRVRTLRRMQAERDKAEWMGDSATPTGEDTAHVD